MAHPYMKCPHRGTDLRGLEVRNGKVTCPLHGLSWRLKTGRLEPSP
ncbi:MAG: Rieske 2Fe-2S domain-containing protein [Chloroflexi bacterium]|nr:Rieske 2Fe-2S domain-containing protein [Chloroflexota bacterium]